MVEGGDYTGSMPMFAIFVLSLYSLYLIPYTIYRLFGSGSDSDGANNAWGSKKPKPDLLSRLRNAVDTKLVVQWVIYLLLLWYVRASARDLRPFDPFAILEVSPQAEEGEIKRAYRRLSLQYHPDKNPDPAAADYFANFISKAYRALTDEVSRENYKKYGHPDGPQAFTVSVALPQWFFSKDKRSAPLILLVLLAFGIVLPLCLAAWYLTRRHRFGGPDGIMHDTLMLFAADPRFGIKESQGLSRIVETLVCAVEFITLPFPASQAAAFEELRRSVLRVHPDLKEKSAMWKMRPSVIKAHLIVLAHLSREPIPAPLRKDAAFILSKSVPMLREMAGIAAAPRVAPGWGWLTPALASLELLQCLVCALPVGLRKKAETSGALAALPHVGEEGAKVLARAHPPVRSPQDLAAMEPEDRMEFLLSGNGPDDQGAAARRRRRSAERAAADSAGAAEPLALRLELPLSPEQALAVEAAAKNQPRVRLCAHLSVEGLPLREDDGVVPGEVVLVSAEVWLERAAHREPGFDLRALKRRGSALAVAPHLPAKKHELWFFVLADPAANACLAFGRAPLVAAEEAGAACVALRRRRAERAERRKRREAAGEVAVDAVRPRVGDDAWQSRPQDSDSEDSVPASSSSSDSEGGEPEGQTVDLAFRAPLKPGRYALVLHCMPDCWVGCDRSAALRLRVVEPSQALLAARAERAAKLAAERMAEAQRERLVLAGEGSEGEEGEEEERDYDSDEVGTEESESEGEREDKKEGDK